MSVAAQGASLPLFAGDNVNLGPHLQALERLLTLLDPDLCAAMVAAHQRDGMGPSAFGFAHEWLMLLGKRQLTTEQARHACVLSLFNFSRQAVRWLLLLYTSVASCGNRCAPHALNKAKAGLLCSKRLVHK